MRRDAILPIVCKVPSFRQSSDESVSYDWFFFLTELLRYPTLEHDIPLCMDHNESALNPHVLSTWVPEKIGGPTNKRLIYLESQVSGSVPMAIQYICNFSRTLNDVYTFFFFLFRSYKIRLSYRVRIFIYSTATVFHPAICRTC